MAENNQIVIDVKINTDEVAKKLGDAQKNIDLIKSAQKMLTKEFKEGTISSEEYGKAIAANKANLETYTREVKSSTALLQAETLARNEDNSSLDAQRQLLNVAQKAYAQLSGAAKEAADQEGGLRDQIKALSDAVKEQESAIGDSRRNVGNYGESITKAFGDMAHAGELISPAVGILRGMGAEGKKAAATLDALGKVLQLTGKAGNVLTQATKAQTVATNGQTVAQEGLNAAMAANPIGLIIAGISTLLPLIQAFCSDTAEAEAAQKLFNAELERQDRLLNGIQNDYDLAAQLAQAEGKSAMEVLQIRREGAEQALAVAEEGLRREEWNRSFMDEKEKARNQEKYDTLKENAKKYAEELRRINNQITVQEVADQRQAKERAQKAADDMKKLAAQTADDLAKIQAAGDEWLIAQMEETAKKRRDIIKDIQKESDELLANTDESEEDDVNAMVARTFGFDDQALQYYMSLLEQGVGAREAVSQTLQDMHAREMQNISDGWAQAADAVAQYGGQAADILGSVFDLVNARGAAELEDYKQRQDAQRKALDDKLKKGLVSQAQYDRQVEAMENALAQKQKEQEIKQAKQKKALAIMETVINTAVGIMKAVSENPMGGGLPGSAIAAALGAIQIATIAAEPLPHYANGGIVPGSSYYGDRVPVMANSGEMYINRADQQKLFDAIKGQNGQSLGMDYEMLALAMANTPAPVLVYSELEEFGQKTANIQEIASI